MTEDEENRLSRLIPMVVSSRMQLKYSILKKAFNKDVILQLIKNGRDIDIIIDIDPIIRSCASDAFAMQYSTLSLERKERVLTYACIKVVGHYKHYFIKQGINPRIFCYYSDGSNSISTNLYGSVIGSSRITEFVKESPHGAVIKELITNGTKLFKKVCEFVDNVYCISSEHIPQAAMPHLILSAKRSNDIKRTAILITNDPLCFSYSLPEYNAVYDNVIVFDNGLREVIDKTNIFRAYRRITTSKKTDTSLDDISGLYLYYRQIISLLGLKKQGINGILPAISSLRGKILKALDEDKNVDLGEILSEITTSYDNEDKYNKTFQIVSPTTIATHITSEDKNNIVEQTRSYTNPDIYEQLTLMFDDLDDGWMTFAVTNFVRGIKT